MGTEYQYARAGSLEQYTGRLPMPAPVIGFRIYVGKARKVADIELTEMEALQAASDLIAAVVKARFRADRNATRGVTA